jgi:hypothetical protein
MTTKMRDLAPVGPYPSCLRFPVDGERKLHGLEAVGARKTTSLAVGPGAPKVWQLLVEQRHGLLEVTESGKDGIANEDVIGMARRAGLPPCQALQPPAQRAGNRPTPRAGGNRDRPFTYSTDPASDGLSQQIGLRCRAGRPEILVLDQLKMPYAMRRPRKGVLVLAPPNAEAFGRTGKAAPFVPVPLSRWIGLSSEHRHDIQGLRPLEEARTRERSVVEVRGNNEHWALRCRGARHLICAAAGVHRIVCGSAVRVARLPPSDKLTGRGNSPNVVADLPKALAPSRLSLAEIPQCKV